MKRFSLIIALLLTLLGVTNSLAAHEGREVYPYELMVGWRNEPAYVGLLNGPEIFISEGGEARDYTFPPSDQVSLRLEVSFGDASQRLVLQHVADQRGRYFADLIPTQPGDYSFHLTGTIVDTVVDEIFTSADGQFGTVEAAADIMFPPWEETTSESDAEIASVETRIATLELLVAQLRTPPAS
jgi:hypothetical protein